MSTRTEDENHCNKSPSGRHCFIDSDDHVWCEHCNGWPTDAQLARIISRRDV